MEVTLDILYRRSAREVLQVRCSACPAVVPVRVQNARANWKKNGRYLCFHCSRYGNVAKVPAAMPDAPTIISDKGKQRWQDPTYAARVHNGMIASRADPRVQARKSAAMQKKWEDPKWVAAELERRNDPAGAAERSRVSLEANSNPEVKAAIGVKARQSWVVDRDKRMAMVPQIKEKLSAHMKRKWENPEYRRHMEAIHQGDEFKTKSRHSAGLQSGKLSSIQAALYKYLDDLDVQYLPEGPGTTIGPYTFDCIIHMPGQRRLLIECQGEYWHGTITRQTKDRSKFTYIERYFPDCEIMYLWEHEFYTSGRVLDRLRLKLGLSIETAEFKVAEVKIKPAPAVDVRAFLDAYHYIGCGRSGTMFGAYHAEKLVAVCVFSAPMRQNHAQLHGEFVELSRLCIHPLYHKKNFASWFVSRCTRRMSQKIVAYADTTVGHTGTVYKAANFKLSHEVSSDFWYVDKDGWVMHKLTLYKRAQKMSMTEADYAAKHGYQKKWGGKKLCFTFGG